ncbi:MAG: chitobiase/beta-hexosaminidase C-terminal domain-containing protein [Muribaculaceae bacterium]
MKKFLLSLVTLVACAFTAGAADIVFDMSDPNAYVDDANKVTYATVADGASSGIGVSYTSGVVFQNGVIKITVEYTSGNGIMAFTQVSKVVQARVYNDAVLTFETTDGSNISSISVDGKNFTSTYFNADKGTMGSGSWTGSANQVVLSCKKSTVNINSITVATADADVIAAPVISPKAGTYYETPVEVTIANPNSTGKVYYTLDGTEPTAASTEYAEAISITATTTVKAVVIDGENASEVVAAEYVISTPVEVANIAEYLAKDAETVVKFTNPVTAVYQKGSYLYVTDDTGSALIYGSTGQTYENGDIVPAGFYGTKTTFNGLVEFSTAAGAGYSTASFQAATEKTDAVTPVVATVADVTVDNANKYFFIADITLDATNKKIVDASGNEVAIYSTLAAIPASGEYDVIGFASVYNDNVQFLPTEYVSKLSVDDVATFRALEVGSIAKLNNPVTVVGVYETASNYNYFVTDETAGITIYALKSDCPAYQVGDVIPGGFRGKLNTYNGNLQIESVENMQESTTTGELNPAVYAIEEISADMEGSYVRIKDVIISDVNNRNITLNDETGSMKGWNRCDLELPDAAATVAVDGVVNLYKSGEDYIVQIIPTAIVVTSDEEDLELGEKVEVIPGTGEITVNGADIVDVYDVDGKPRTTTVKGSGDTPKIIRVGEGIYIVVADGEAVKVIVD